VIGSHVWLHLMNRSATAPSLFDRISPWCGWDSSSSRTSVDSGHLCAAHNEYDSRVDCAVGMDIRQAAVDSRTPKAQLPHVVL
jgi:hypothetical protein